MIDEGFMNKYIAEERGDGRFWVYEVAVISGNVEGRKHVAIWDSEEEARDCVKRWRLSQEVIREFEI